MFKIQNSRQEHIKMWTNSDSLALIGAIEISVMKRIPTATTNNNHEYTGNLIDIPSDWNSIAENIDRSGIFNYVLDILQMVTCQFANSFLDFKMSHSFLVVECKNRWHELIRQFLFITGRVNNDQRPQHFIYPIQWLLMEQMTFLIPYMEKYKK